MSEIDLQLGGGYTYQWDCAILLALNYFYEPVRYNPVLFDLVTDFLGQVAEIHLEGEDRENGVDLEDVNLVDADGGRRILIQVKTKQAAGERWTLSDPLLLKALYRFYDSRFLADRPDSTRFAFLTNRPFNPDLVRVMDAIKDGTIDQCPEADKLYQHLDRHARREKGAATTADRYREMLSRTIFVEYLAVDEVKANVQAKLQALGCQHWEQVYTVLFEHFARESTRVGGGVVTRASLDRILESQGAQGRPDDSEGARTSRQVAKARDGIAVAGGIHAGRDVIMGNQYNYPGQQPGQIATPAEFVAQLQALQAELAKLKQRQTLPPVQVEQIKVVEENVQQAVEEAQKPEPLGARITAALTGAKAVLEATSGSVRAAVGLGTVLAGLIQVASQLF